MVSILIDIIIAIEWNQPKLKAFILASENKEVYMSNFDTLLL